MPTSISVYGSAIGTCQREDLGLHYARIQAEMVKYNEDGMNIMIKNKWMEQAPLAADREKLSNKNNLVYKIRYFLIKSQTKQKNGG